MDRRCEGTQRRSNPVRGSAKARKRAEGFSEVTARHQESDGVSKSRRRNPPPARTGSGGRGARSVGGSDAASNPVAPADHLLSKCLPRARLGVASASFAATRVAIDRSLISSTRCPARAVDRPVPDPFRKALVRPRCSSAAMGAPVRVRTACQLSAGRGATSRGPLWPTRIEIGQGFVNDSS